MLDVTERRAVLLALPSRLARMQGSALGMLDRLTLGLLPDDLVMTRDQAIMLETDNVVSAEAIAEDRTLQGLGITPTAYEAIVPCYLVRFRRTGQFDLKRNAGSDDTSASWGRHRPWRNARARPPAEPMGRNRPGPAG